MAYTTSAGSKVYYCATVNPTAATTSAYAALTWVELTGVESVGAFGDTSQAVTFDLLAEGRTRKLKGSRDAGNMAINCVRDPLSASQAAMVGFEATAFSYAFKVLLADGADANDTDSAFYCTGKVMDAPVNVGGPNDPTRRTFNVAIDTAIFEARGAAVSG